MIAPRSCGARGRVPLLGAMLFGVIAACGDPAGPREEPLPIVAYEVQDAGFRQLFLLVEGRSTRLTNEAVDHRSPSIAAGYVAWESNRHGQQDIFFSALSTFEPRRITSHAANDQEPHLRPDGGAILFMSYRSGAPRIWLSDTLGIEQTPVPTGSPSFVPERSPRWSPDGEWIAFISTRTGTAQVWVMPAAGGDAVQLSRESGGAFDFAWGPDGQGVIYMTPDPDPRLRSVPLGGGDARDVASDPAGLSQPDCFAGGCVAVRAGGTEGFGGLVRIGPGGALRPVAGSATGARRPSLAR